MTMRQNESAGTGQELALKMAKQFPGHDWVAELAAHSGKSRDFVEWHLQQEMPPPAEIASAAVAMLAAASRPDEREPDRSGALLTEDDLPFSGLPGNLGKLHRD
ncbi:hypothetical protein QO058_27955 [Bosea vestrisii]|uniref:hypothetical protein n=1 Tax=Bosea vestrisii TaxID=151416 RepID=UPI0024DF4226|nr:hypothetical protein [Bosea vestrisii]WID96504.1 hypothetical protein QO058_27955 [Bosea vestrisii]